MTSLTLQLKPQLSHSLKSEMCSQTSLRPSMCRCCKFYQIQGRGSGHCHKLGVSVCSNWRSCTFAMSPFAPSWEGLGEIRVY